MVRLFGVWVGCVVICLFVGYKSSLKIDGNNVIRNERCLVVIMLFIYCYW